MKDGDKQESSGAIFNCPICGKPLRQVITVWIEAPASMRAVTKTALRSSKVEILGVDRPPVKEWECPEHGPLGSIRRRISQKRDMEIKEVNR